MFDIVEGESILFVDDDIKRRDKFDTFFEQNNITHVHGFLDAIELLEKTRFDAIFFDCDLCDQHVGDLDDGTYNVRQYTGADIASWIRNNKSAAPRLSVIHSENPTCAEHIEAILEDVCEVIVKPFSDIENQDKTGI